MIRRQPSPNAHSAGLTIVELALAALVFALLMGSVGIVSFTSFNAIRSTTLRTDVETKVQRAVERVAKEVITLGSIDVATDPTAAGGTARLDFIPITGVAGNAVVWGTTTRLDLQYAPGELNDGLDNNGDGLIDEGVLVLVRDQGGPAQLQVILCRNVSEFLEGEIPNGIDDNGNGVVDERGFSLHRVGQELRVRLTVLQPMGANGQVLSRTTETTVKLRNLNI